MFREFLTQRIKRGLVRRFNNLKIAAMSRRVARKSPQSSGAPVVFFKASTGIDDLSWNSGFHLLASWALRLKGVPVAYFACNAGMRHCVLGTDRDDPRKAPPCHSCVVQSRTLYAGLRPPESSRSTPEALWKGQRPRRSVTDVNWFSYERDESLSKALAGLSVPELMRFEWVVDFIASPEGHSPREGEIVSPHIGLRSAQEDSLFTMTLPLGKLCLPGLRWILRIHHLPDDESTGYLLREYILSAWNIARQFAGFLDRTQPRAVILFNGQFYPEAVARYLAQERGIRVITHEVGLQPATAFFTEGEATAYPIHIPEEFDLSASQNARLDAYLAKRFQGDFTMAGIRFWADMQGLDQAFLEQAARFKQIVPVFTNVIFDTNQPHANTVFEDMFAWLDMVLEIIRAHPETLFVIRAHPDELRVRKASRETVAAWAEASGADREPNVVFVGPRETLSSYELIQRSKFVMVYNSTIGLEASIMGAAVLCAGKARFTQYPTVFFPESVDEVKNKMEEFLDAETIEIPDEFMHHARRFLYYQLYKTSLPFDAFLEPSVRTTQTRLKSFGLRELLGSDAIKVILDGVLNGGDFLLKE